MRILYLHQHFTTPQGSGGIRSYEMAQRCVKEGLRVTMVCGKHSDGVSGLMIPFKWGRRSGNVDGIDIIEYNLSYSNNDSFLKRTFLFLLFSFRAVIVSLTHKYDIIFATTTPLTAGIPGIFARWLRGKRFIFEVRDLWPELPKAMGVIKNPLILIIMEILEWATYKSAHKLIGLSPGICKGIEAKGISSDRILEIPNGCDIELFSKDIKKWRPVGTHLEDLLFIFSGAHGLANGLNSVLDAVKVLEYRGVNGYKIIMIGNGKQKKELVTRAINEKLDDKIIFLDSIPKESLIGLFRSCDVGLQILANVPAFYFGTSPNKFFDYLAAGLPVLTNYPGWIANLIVENRCGIVCEPDDPEKFADQVVNILKNRFDLVKMGKSSSELANKYFNRTDLSQKWIDWVIS
jgi:glycosyltransferase involved in cell wall biosynthesis